MKSIVAKNKIKLTPITDLDTSNIYYGNKAVLAHYMERNTKPSDVDLRSPLFKDLTRKDALDLLKDALDKHDLEFNHYYVPPEILTNEVNAMLKGTSKSIRRSYSERLVKILPYFKTFKGINRNVKRILVNFVIPRAMKLLDPGRLRILSAENAVHEIKKNTQWGTPFLTKGTISWPDHLEIVQSCLISGNFDKIMNLPCLLGWRGQPGKGETAQRVVWMYPHSASILDCMVVKPLMKALDTKKQFIMLNGEFRCSIYITEILKISEAADMPTLGFDASAFDSSILREVIQLSFVLVRFWFQKSAHVVIDFCEKYLMESSLLGLDLIEGRTSSMPSGSGFTNILDTIIQYIYFLYVAYYMKRNEDYDSFIEKCHFTGMGDDGVWFIPNLDVVSLTKILQSLNVVCEPSKQSFSSKYVSFCQNIYSLEWVDDFGKCRGVRSVIRTFNSMISMERFRKGFTAMYHSVRWIVQLEDCWDNPFFPELLSLVLNNDKFKLGLSLPNRVSDLFSTEVLNLKNYFKVLGDNFRYQKIIRDNTTSHTLRMFRLINSLPIQDEYNSEYLRSFINNNLHNFRRSEYGINRIHDNTTFIEYTDKMFTIY